MTAASTARGRRSRLWVAALIALACVAAMSFSAWSAAPNWSNADSLYYQSMSYEIDGMSAQAARVRVFDSSLARAAIRAEPSVANAAWREFESRFSRRRWIAPVLAAALRPLAGVRALPDAAIIGYLVFGVCLGLLLALRFAVPAAVATVIVCLASGTVRDWCVRPMSDSWGLAVLTLCLVVAIVVLDHGGGRWLALWVAAMLLLSFARDLAPIPLVGLAGLAWRDRARRRLALLMVITGVLATIPTYLAFGESLRLTLAFQMSGFEIPTHAHATWGYVLAHYPNLARKTIAEDLSYLRVHLDVAVPYAVGVVGLFAVRAHREPLIVLMRWAALGWLVVFALDPDSSGFRYELTLLPCVAVGVCLLGSELARRLLPPGAHRRLGLALQPGR